MSAWYEQSAAKELTATPWLHPAVIAYLESLVRPEWNVLEHGSGGSTLWLAERCAQVTAVEHNTTFYHAVCDRAPNNVRVWFYDGLRVPDGLCRDYDLLLIDGEPVEVRAHYLQRATELVKAGGAVVLDNANRPEYANERAWLMRQAADWFTVESHPQGMRYLVTDIYTLC